MHPTSILLTLLAFTSTSLSLPQKGNSWFAPGPDSPTLPPSDLPPPSGNVKYIVLGVGTQNYTCADSQQTTVPAAVGAIATLYDATDAMSTKAAQKYPFLANQGMTCYADKYNTGFGLKQVGNHFFNGGGQPSFNLPGLGSSYLLAKKMNATAAPSNACTGRNGAGAVPWLYLVDNGLGGSRNVNTVYRVRTTGGSAPATCDGMGSSFTVDYAAEYWFYNS